MSPLLCGHEHRGCCCTLPAGHGGNHRCSHGTLTRLAEIVDHTRPDLDPYQQCAAQDAYERQIYGD